MYALSYAHPYGYFSLKITIISELENLNILDYFKFLSLLARSGWSSVVAHVHMAFP